MLWFLKKIPPDKIFPRSYMDFEQKYQKDPGMNRVKKDDPSGMVLLRADATEDIHAREMGGGPLT